MLPFRRQKKPLKSINDRLERLGSEPAKQGRLWHVDHVAHVDQLIFTGRRLTVG